MHDQPGHLVHFCISEIYTYLFFQEAEIDDEYLDEIEEEEVEQEEERRQPIREREQLSASSSSSSSQGAAAT